MTLEADIETETSDELKMLIASFLRKEKEYQSEIKILKEQLRCLQDKLFGRKSEKRSFDDKQLYLFDLPEENYPIAEEPEKVDAADTPKRTPKKRGRKAIPGNFPRIDVVHDVDDKEKQCECGCRKTRIGEEVSEQLDIVPAKIQVIRNIRPKYVCKNCEGVDSDGPTVAIAPLPEQIIPKSIGTPGLIASVLVAKYEDALPFYRQEKQFKRIGVKISRAAPRIPLAYSFNTIPPVPVMSLLNFWRAIRVLFKQTGMQATTFLIPRKVFCTWPAGHMHAVNFSMSSRLQANPKMAKQSPVQPTRR